MGSPGLTTSFRFVRNMLRLLPIAIASLMLIGCATLAYSPSDPVPEYPNSETLTPGAPSSETFTPGVPDPDTPTPSVSDPVNDAPEPAEIPHGSIALFNRVTLGNSSDYWPTKHGRVSWTTGGRGILRYIPDNDSYEMMKRITTTSGAPSTVNQSAVTSVVDICLPVAGSSSSMPNLLFLEVQSIPQSRMVNSRFSTVMA